MKLVGKVEPGAGFEPAKERVSTTTAARRLRPLGHPGSIKHDFPELKNFTSVLSTPVLSPALQPPSL